MSNIERSPTITVQGGLARVAPNPVHALFAGRLIALGGSTTVTRVLPNLGRRLVGPWCFFDQYGPENITSTQGAGVPPHPHTGLQTVSWLLDGQIHHRDSLGNDQLISRGELGLMTAGRGIVHAEHSPVLHPALLHGAQLWIALPSAVRETAPSWQHERQLPVITDNGFSATVIVGSLADASSPARSFWPIVGVDVDLDPGGATQLPIEPDFEHAVCVTSGTADVDGVPMTPGSLLYLGSQRRGLHLSTDTGARLLLLGGQPFEEQIVMWWNFVAGSHDEIVQARKDWIDGTRFPSIPGAGDPLPAPPLPPGHLNARGSVRMPRQ
jgi:redox-sensitive bicupin YhaK (pirin superfamily)